MNLFTIIALIFLGAGMICIAWNFLDDSYVYETDYGLEFDFEGFINDVIAWVLCTVIAAIASLLV